MMSDVTTMENEILHQPLIHTESQLNTEEGTAMLEYEPQAVSEETKTSSDEDININTVTVVKRRPSFTTIKARRSSLFRRQIATVDELQEPLSRKSKEKVSSNFQNH